MMLEKKIEIMIGINYETIGILIASIFPTKEKLLKAIKTKYSDFLQKIENKNFISLIIQDFVRLLDRSGNLNATFFVWLLDQNSSHREEILVVAHIWQSRREIPRKRID